MLISVGFEMQNKAPRQTPSPAGGDEARAARAMCLNADILLMDEPTNPGRDEREVGGGVPARAEERDVHHRLARHRPPGPRVQQHIAIDTLKLKQSRGTLSSTSRRTPRRRSSSSRAAPICHARPNLGSSRPRRNQTLDEDGGVTYTYPVNEEPTVKDVTAVSLASVAARANGVGKSTMIKLLTARSPSGGSKHPNARGAVAQHAFHHIEQHLDKTPNEHIRMFQHGTTRKLVKDNGATHERRRGARSRACPS